MSSVHVHTWPTAQQVGPVPLCWLFICVCRVSSLTVATLAQIARLLYLLANFDVSLLYTSDKPLLLSLCVQDRLSATHHQGCCAQNMHIHHTCQLLVL